jgi:hypothetical protein
MDALACPSILCAAFTLAPADTARLAAVRRRSCGAIEGMDHPMRENHISDEHTSGRHEGSGCAVRTVHLTADAGYLVDRLSQRRVTALYDQL